MHGGAKRGERRRTKQINMRKKGIEMGGGGKRENTSALDRRVESNMYI